MGDPDGLSRRRLVETVGLGLAVGAAGCIGGGSGPSTCNAKSPPKGDVASKYRTASSQGGAKRKPNGLNKKSTVSYQKCPNGNSKCSNCKYFVPPQGNDDFGACARVEGYINPTGWCRLYTKQ